VRTVRVVMHFHARLPRSKLYWSVLLLSGSRSSQWQQQGLSRAVMVSEVAGLRFTVVLLWIG
jgi:hypothetical protein